MKWKYVNDFPNNLYLHTYSQYFDKCPNGKNGGHSNVSSLSLLVFDVTSELQARFTCAHILYIYFLLTYYMQLGAYSHQAATYPISSVIHA